MLLYIVEHAPQVLTGLVVQAGATFLEAEVHRQPLRMSTQRLITLGHQCIGGNGHGLDGLGNKTVGGDNGLAFVALGKRHQGFGPGVFSVGWQVEKQAAGQRIILRRNQAVERRHGL
ncbi:hypothetical protein D3C81_1787610 [compost metagenome]